MLGLEYLTQTHKIFTQKTGACMLFESFFRSIFALLECYRFLISNLAWYTLYHPAICQIPLTNLLLQGRNLQRQVLQQWVWVRAGYPVWNCHRRFSLVSLPKHNEINISDNRYHYEAKLQLVLHSWHIDTDLALDFLSWIAMRIYHAFTRSYDSSCRSIGLFLEQSILI